MSRALSAMPAAAVSDALLARLKRRSTQALVDALWVKGWPNAMMEGPRPLLRRKMAGRAVTLQFLPHRPDLAADKPTGVESPECAHPFSGRTTWALALGTDPSLPARPT